MGRRVLLCPQCGSRNLAYEAGMVAGQLYHCEDCDYVGAFVIQQDVDAAED